VHTVILNARAPFQLPACSSSGPAPGLASRVNCLPPQAGLLLNLKVVTCAWRCDTGVRVARQVPQLQGLGRPNPGATHLNASILRAGGVDNAHLHCNTQLALPLRMMLHWHPWSCELQ